MTGLALSLSNASFADVDTLAKNLKNNYPNLSAKVVGESPVDNIYEVQVAGNLVYTDEDARYFFVGNLVDFKNKTNITEQRQQELSQIDISQLPLEDAIKNVKGNGERKLYVFSDPDCPFCKKLEHEIAQMTDVTIYTFLMPIDSLHPQATAKSIQLWCQPNRTEAWTKWMRDGVAPAQVPVCDNPVEKLAKLSEGFGFNGTPTIVYPNGKIQSGYMPKADFEAALKQNQS